MWAWRKRDDQEHSWRGAASAALAGAPREELLREAIHCLALDGRADRIGVWLEQDGHAGSDPLAPTCLRGIVWEARAEETAADWEKLSLEPPLPQELLASTKSVYQDLDCAPGRSPNQPMIGPLVGVRHALWTPIRGKSHLRGVLLTAAQRKSAALSRELAESVAAELALALEWEQEQRLARERQADVRLSKEILNALAGGASSDTILSQLAASCTDGSPNGAGAGFALIGYRPAQASHAAAAEEMEFAWESGNAVWTGAGAREPLGSLWRAALVAGHIVGAEAAPAWSKDGLARLVAIPLTAAEETLGVLLAGIPQKTSSLATLERLDLRASLAVAALERRKSHLEQVRRTARGNALLEASPEATILLDARGSIAGLNRSARILLEEEHGEPAQGGNEEHADPLSGKEAGWAIGGRFESLFCAREQPGIEEWSTRILAGGRDQTPEMPDAGERELITGVRVRLHAPVAAGDGLAAVVLAPAASHEA
ncbi:MAG: hypothetical protein WAN62_12265, partial [Candidatus Acidiferrum sp.]